MQHNVQVVLPLANCMRAHGAAIDGVIGPAKGHLEPVSMHHRYGDPLHDYPHPSRKSA